jgi:zinc protease
MKTTVSWLALTAVVLSVVEAGLKTRLYQRVSVVSAQSERRPAAAVTLREPDSPFVAFTVWVKVGSQNDPKGKQGLAALTANLLAQGSTRRDTYEQILAKLYPMAARYQFSVDKEMTAFTGRVHRDNLEAYYSLFKNVVLSPAFREDDFTRIKTETLNYLKQARRFSNDEELSKELLYREIFRGTPYEHPEEGYVRSVESIGLDDAKAFYAKYYTRDNVVAGVAGSYPETFANRMRGDLDMLPAGRVASVPKATPAAIDGLKILIVEKKTNATPISFGFPISLLRSDPDFHAMMLANSWLGEHRTAVSHLFQVIRATRGLNYGDYTYIEAYPRGFATQVPPTNVSRRSQIFEAWIRPVSMTAPGTLHDRSLFAFRAALREITKVVETGMTPDAFEAQRRYLKNYSVNFGVTLGRRLAYRIDDVFYGLPEPGFLASIGPGLDALTVETVNAAIKRHLRARNMSVVFITQDAEGMKKKLLEGTGTPISYAGKQPQEVLDEDKIIASYPIPVTPDDIVIMNIDEVFEK